MSRRLPAAPVLLACTVLASPTLAGQLLYATAATLNRVDGFCICPNGGLAPTRFRERATVNNPRRVIVPPEILSDDSGLPYRLLYVAGNTRVEALKIDPEGQLSSLGHTPFVQGANPRDIVVDFPKRKLYVPHRAQDRIVAYQLDDKGGFAAEDFTSCARGPIATDWENMQLVGDRLYATAEAGRGSIFVYRVAPDGSLPESAADVDANGVPVCNTFSSVQTEPISERRCLDGAGPILVQDDVLYVAARLRRRILSFVLASDGLFTPAVPVGTGGCKKLDQQKYSSRTKHLVRYIDLVRQNDTIFGSFFDGGRVHAFPLKESSDDGRMIALPKKSRAKTNKSFVRTPVRLATAVSGNGQPTLYVPGGVLDRIEAFRLVERKRGLVMKPKPFSRTDEDRRSFPNDAVVTEVPNACNNPCS